MIMKSYAHTYYTYLYIYMPETLLFPIDPKGLMGHFATEIPAASASLDCD